jgi:hypothetical protein
VDALQKLLEKDYPRTAIGFDVARDTARQDALWQGRRGALQVLYGYGQGKRPLTMIECVVIPRDEKKILEFISYMEEVFNEEQVVAGTHDMPRLQLTSTSCSTSPNSKTDND